MRCVPYPLTCSLLVTAQNTISENPETLNVKLRFFSSEFLIVIGYKFGIGTSLVMETNIVVGTSIVMGIKLLMGINLVMGTSIVIVTKILMGIDLVMGTNLVMETRLVLEK